MENICGIEIVAADIVEEEKTQPNLQCLVGLDSIADLIFINIVPKVFLPGLRRLIVIGARTRSEPSAQGKHLCINENING